LAEKVRNANGEGSSWKSAANKKKHTCEGRKIPFIKNACNNFDEKEIETNTKDRN
jgi:hypothetical protein